MKQKAAIKILLYLLFFHSWQGFAQKYEAEKATLSGGAVKQYSTAASGGAYVAMNDGNISFSVQMQEAGIYNLKIVFSLTDDDFNTQNLTVNGKTVGSVSFLRTGSESKLVFADATTFVRLVAGANTVAITKSWGWVDIDYIELATHETLPFTIDPYPVTPEPSESAMELYSFLCDNFQKKTISGVMTGTLLNRNDVALPLFSQVEVAHIYRCSGKKPALVGFDFMHSTGKNSEDSWYKAYSNATISMATKLWEAGGIPIFCWHWKDPLLNQEEFYTDETTFDLTEAFTNSSCTEWNTNSASYKAIIRDIDFVAGLLKKLQDKGIAVLWRPLHEASGGWFWWGAKGSTPCKALYKLMFDRMVNHNGLRNLIWVWTANGVDADWYPGNNCVDIIGRDFYYEPIQRNHASLIGEFETFKMVFGTNKIITLAENGSVPYPAEMQNDGAHWSYFMPWEGEFVTSHDHNTVADWKLIMNDDYIITLEDMPGWKNVAIINTGISVPQVYPNPVCQGESLQIILPPELLGGFLSIYDMKGSFKKWETLPAATNHTIDTFNLNQGTWLFHIAGKGGVEQVVKVIVE